MKKSEGKIEELKRRISALEKENEELRKKKRKKRYVFPEIREIVLSDGTTEKISQGHSVD